ncbi:hypothetical protein TNCT_531011 [Trichonephila clavata]|uniref:Uncharacterized protein n=1 Tax=Trichonephila clavata TaxID=2740835 RepID=A0A8X6JBZ2_TRICU|nr:hypothetical protein TNCT_531011 [Trichonephila clavata]
MAFSFDHPTDMEFQQVSLPTSGTSTPELPVDPTPCAKLEVPKTDIQRYTLIVKGHENMILSLRQSNAQGEHGPTFVEMTKQLTYYENLLEKPVSVSLALSLIAIPLSALPTRHQLVLP